MSERDTRNQQSDWNDRDRRDRDYRNAPRQPQQWHDESYGGGQLGYDDRTRDRDYGGGQLGGSHASYSGERQRNWQDDDDRARRASQPSGDYREERQSYGAGYGSGYYDDRASRFGSFTSEDQGGRDFSGARQGPYVGRASFYGYAYSSGDRNRDYAGDYRDNDTWGRAYGSDARGRSRDRDWQRSSYRPQGYAAAGRDYMSGNDYGDWREYGERRGFFERAGDEIASWFGDDDAARRRERDHRENERGGHDHRGRGPSNYTRSDERIREDANDALTHDRSVDASHVTVRVDKGEVTLDGHVHHRDAKRRAEDAVDRISGVKHVQNNLRVVEDHNRANVTSGSAAGSSWSATGSAAPGSTAATTAANPTGAGTTKTS